MRNRYQLESASRLRARDVTLTGVRGVLSARGYLSALGPGEAGGGGSINQPELDENGEFTEAPHGFFRVGDKVGSKPLG